MTPRRRRRTRLVLEAHAPPSPAGAESVDDGRLRPRPGEVDWVGTAQALQVNSTPLARMGLRLAVAAAWWSPLWLGRRWGSLGRLDPEDRAACIAALGQHRLHLVREAAFLMKIVVGSALLGVPSLRARSRYDAEPAPAGLPGTARRPRGASA